MLIRNEVAGDRAAVHALNAAAFDTAAEADLVDALRERARPLVSLVAEDGGALIGHILFSPVALPGHPRLAIMGLAPMAVAAEHRGRGVGSALARAGPERCRETGCDAVVVLGHPALRDRLRVRCARGGVHDPGIAAGRAGRRERHGQVSRGVRRPVTVSPEIRWTAI
jgi:putative acetyltransferase